MYPGKGGLVDNPRTGRLRPPAMKVLSLFPSLGKNMQSELRDRECLRSHSLGSDVLLAQPALIAVLGMK